MTGFHEFFLFLQIYYFFAMGLFTRQGKKFLFFIFIRKICDPTSSVHSTCGPLELSQEDKNPAFINLHKKIAGDEILSCVKMAATPRGINASCLPGSCSVLPVFI